MLAILIAVGGTVGGTAAVATASASAAGLTGAGSTLVAPLMANWINGFEIKEGIPVKYSAVGSGEGIKQISNGTVDFGASDAPMTPEQESNCSGCVTIPWALSATGLGFNIPGIKKLNLSGKVIAGIYFGNITKWNDAKIKKLNPKAKLPNLKITPIYRSDGSGDTYAFTNYLSKVSPAWRSEVGYATTVGWKSGIGAKGNAGVTSTVAKTQGAIGYISASYLIAAGSLGVVAVQNNAGNYEFPNLKNIEEAGTSVKLELQQHGQHHQPAEEVQEGVPDLDVHVRDRAAQRSTEDVPGAVPELRRHEGAGLRCRPRLRAAAEGRRDGREEGDRLALSD
ncbi:MAG: phosphate ABC transporter substrate-binding protein PstS [Solirubrobacterales bacterium]